MSTIDDTRTRSNTAVHCLGKMIVGLYAWTTAVYFGFVWLDSAYARLVIEPGAAFRTVADVLLVLGSGMVLLGLAAIVMAANSDADVKVLIGSVMLALLMFPAPVLLSAILQDGAGTLGPPIRILLVGLVSALAFLGFGRYERRM